MTKKQFSFIRIFTFAFIVFSFLNFPVGKLDADTLPVISQSDQDQIYVLLNDLKQYAEREGISAFETFFADNLVGEMKGIRIWKQEQEKNRIKEILVVLPEKLHFELETPIADIYILFGGELGTIQHWDVSFIWANGKWKIKDLNMDRSQQFGFNQDKLTYLSYPVTGLSLNFDSIGVQIDSGTLGSVKAGSSWVGLTFRGKGRFTFTPPEGTESEYLKERTGKSVLSTAFTKFFLWGESEDIAKILTDFSLIESGNAVDIDDVKDNFTGKLKGLSDLGIYPISSLAMKDTVFGKSDWYFLETRRGKVILELETMEYDWLTYIFDPRGFLSDKLAGWTEEVGLVKHIRPMLGTEKTMEIFNVFDKESDRKYMSFEEREWEDKDQLIILNYDIQLTCSHGRNIQCEAGLKLRSLENRLKQLQFRLLDTLSVDRVWDSKNREYFIFQNGSTISIPLIDTLRSGEEFKIYVKYHGDAVKEYGNRQNSLLSSVPWLPQYGYLSTQTMEMVLKVPKPYVAVSVGTLVKTWEEGAYNASQWREMRKIPLPGIVFGEYNLTRYMHQSLLDTEFDSYTTDLTYNLLATSKSSPAVESTDGVSLGGDAGYIDKSPGTMLSNSGEIVKFYNKIFGPYRFSKLAITHLPFRADYREGLITLYGQGLPSIESRSLPSLIILEEDSMRSAAEKARLGYKEEDALAAFESRLAGSRVDSRAYDAPPQKDTYDFLRVNDLPELMAKEIAKQWWGNSVIWKNYHDAWLSESISEFASALYVQVAHGDKELGNILNTWKQYAKSYDDLGPLWQGADRLGSHYADLLKSKGAYIHQMLRMMFPKGVYLGALEVIYKEFQEKPITTYAFKNKLEKYLISSPDVGIKYMKEQFGTTNLDWFFDEWIMKQGIPKYSFEYQIEETGPEGIVAKCKITPKTKGFIMPLRLWVHYKDETKESFVTMVKDTVKEISLTRLPSKPKKIVLNEFNEVLCDIDQ
ncbi:MAG: hypothetical protein A2161_09465 [Candidatus Schekmanbacteria bacterium RBG_13_48_7]|uniref:Peptidase M1 membrane alanine aminopeptidase domain-containing protein n=1 Tax=Candidatus Schekmanbacteria bacterium RBG_13_48_7 TaxID=1817878 RepID=A0A1F7RIW9_9BACT|nr:MAG: hypothetical protein A2161_09465 [Candidatus Schekmanbacteria bacterium RBG_13_48_7]